jgi:hypothetical protein
MTILLILLTLTYLLLGVGFTAQAHSEGSLPKLAWAFGILFWGVFVLVSIGAQLYRWSQRTIP